MKNKRANPKRIIQTISHLFNPILGKHPLRNMILATIAIASCNKMRINEIARHLPTKVKREKHRQKRLLRFLKRGIPSDKLMQAWAKFVLERIYRNSKGGVIILDETMLSRTFKGIVAAVPFRKRAIPIYFMAYSDEQIRSMQYLSRNQIVDLFVDRLCGILKEALGERSKRMIWLFDRGFADARFMDRVKDKITFLIRVKKDSWVEVEGRCKYAGKLEGFKEKGLFPNVLYHKERRLRLHLYSNPNGDDPLFLVSNSLFCLHQIYRLRMQIEQGFRDLKSLFGFKSLVLKKEEQSRVEMLFCLVCIGMGILMIEFEKSAYRWMRFYCRRCKRKVYSLVRVIRGVVMDSWRGLCLEPYFPLPLSSFERG